MHTTAEIALLLAAADSDNILAKMDTSEGITIIKQSRGEISFDGANYASALYHLVSTGLMRQGRGALFHLTERGQAIAQGISAE